MQRLKSLLTAALYPRSIDSGQVSRYGRRAFSTELEKGGAGEVAPLDLKSLAENADPETLAEINRLRQAINELHAQFTVPSNAENLDWAQWEGRLLSKGLVTSMRKAFESLQPPELEKERQELLRQIDSSFEPLIKQAQELAKDAEARLKALDDMLKELDGLQKNLPRLTVDELMAKRPDLASEVESDLKQSKWFRL